jgi:hypothetical protein
LTERTEENNEKVRTIGVMAEIQTRHLPYVIVLHQILFNEWMTTIKERSGGSSRANWNRPKKWSSPRGDATSKVGRLHKKSRYTVGQHKGGTHA